jgi:hypothetical protein
LSGWKDWEIGEVVEAGEFQTFIQDQVVQVYADSAARGSALGTAVAEGMASYVKDTDSFEVYDGSGWVPVSVDAAWVTAGTAGQILISNGTADPSWVEAETTLAAGSAGELVVSGGTAGVVYEAAEATLTAGTSGFTALSAGTAGISYQPVSHNYIINGAFDVWQRGTSFSATGYTADRWRYLQNAGTGTLTRQTLSPNEINANGFGDIEYFSRVAVTSSVAFQGTNQFVEDVRTLAGQTATLSFWAKGTNPSTGVVNLAARQNFGSGGSAQVNTDIGSVALTGSWQRFSRTVTIPSIAGKTIGANSYLFIDFFASSAASSAAWTLDLTGVQLEAGSVATPFKRHAPSLQGELAACQRYYQRVAMNATAYPFGLGFATTTSNARVTIPLACNMRATPSVENDSATIRHEGTNFSISAFASVVLGFGAAVTLNATTTVSTMTPNQLAVISANQAFALSAEL